MVRGLFTSYTGMINQQYRLDTITNNLANASTTAYKREGATSKSFSDLIAIKVNDLSTGSTIHQKIGSLSLGVKIGENYTDYTQGSYKSTGNTYDLAIEGKGFFSISYTNKSGEESVKYSRDGEFTVDNEGVLRTTDGDYVLGEGGIITVPTDAVSISVDQQGRIFADNEYVDTLEVVDFEDYNYLAKFGENLYEAVEGATQIDSTAKVFQGYLEASNVNVVKEMVEMITITRAYDANQKVMKAIDETLDKAANSVGSVR